MVVPVPRGDVRRDLRLGEVADQGAELLVVLAELEHGWPFVVAEDRPTVLDVDVNVKHDGLRDNPLPAPSPAARTDAGGAALPGSTWTIAEVAEQFGITHRTVRHYEDLGLISPERRGTTRVYHRRDRTRLNLILRGKRLGFPLEEIRTIIDMYDEQPGEAGQLTYLLGQIGDRRAELERRRQDIEDSLTELADLERRCEDDLRALR